MVQFADAHRLIKRLHEFAAGRDTHHSKCDLCHEEIGSEHRHLLEPTTEKLYCACDACRILFDYQVEGRFRVVPTSVVSVPDLELSESQLTALGIPIGMAFITLKSVPTASTPPDVVTPPRVVGWYPSPAGLVQSSPEQDVWESIADSHSALRDMQPDVEALLINHTQNHRCCLVTPIDVCYRLVGIVRQNWEGWSGGPQLWREVDDFFEQLVPQVNERGLS